MGSAVLAHHIPQPGLRGSDEPVYAALITARMVLIRGGRVGLDLFWCEEVFHPTAGWQGELKPQGHVVRELYRYLVRHLCE